MFGNYIRSAVGIGPKTSLRGLCLLVILGIANLLWLPVAYGAPFPSKTIQIVSPFPPGGKTDLTPRLLSKKLSALLGQQIIVANKAGGMGAAGIQYVAVGAPDGYTLLVAAPSIIISPLTLKNIPYSLKQFTPINLSVTMPILVTVKNDAPWKTLPELIAEAKKNPGKLSYSSSGPSTLPHIAGELLKITTGTNITHIPMDGAAKAITAVLGNHVNMTFSAYGGDLKSHLEAGTLRTLTVMSRNRLKDFPKIPTTGEIGYPNLISIHWHAFLVRAKTSPAIVKRLGDAFHEALKDKEVIGLFDQAGLPIENLNREETTKFLAEEEKRLAEVVRTAKIEQ